MLLMLSLHAVSENPQTGKGTTVEERMLDLQISRERERLALLEKGAGPEEMRRQMARWEDENKDSFLEVEKLRAEEVKISNETVPSTGLPEQMPVFAGDNPEEFLAAAESYLTQMREYFRASSSGASDRPRSLIADFMAEPWHQELEKSREEAYGILVEQEEARISADPEIPLTADEMATLPEEEQIAERIFSIQHEAMKEPLKREETVRDRMASIEPLIEDEQKKLEKIPNETKIERARNWVSQLEAHKNQNFKK